MKCPSINDLPAPPPGKSGWPWTDSGNADVSHLASHISHPLPRITLVMPCLNAAPYIEEALRSVLLQGYPDLEVIVFDGGSTDGTVDVIKRYAPWLTFWVSEKDSGQSHAINKGLRLASGEWFNWFNADDVMCEGGMQALMSVVQGKTDVVGICGAMQVFNDKGPKELLLPVAGSKAELGNWANPAYLHQPAAVFRGPLCKAIGGLNENLHYVMDIELMMRLADHGQFLTTNRVVTCFRSHPGSKTEQGDMAGLVELIAVNFNLGMPQVANRLLQRRMDGYAGLAMDRLNDEGLAKMADRWTYGKVGGYLFRRVCRNVALRWKKMMRSTNPGK